MAKYITNNAGNLEEATPVTTSAGAADGAKIVQLDAGGKLDITLFPTGIGADAVTILASEAIAAGAWVNVYNNAGTANVRNAIASGPGFKAFGYVKSAVASGASATVFFDDVNDSLSGLTPGEQYLSSTVPGAGTATAPSASGKIVQKLGVATSTTSVHASISMLTVTLA
jgi:hypothetical protein